MIGAMSTFQVCLATTQALRDADNDIAPGDGNTGNDSKSQDEVFAATTAHSKRKRGADQEAVAEGIEPPSKRGRKIKPTSAVRSIA